MSASDLKIVAIVKHPNGEELLVLNRQPNFVYTELPGGHLLGFDGPFDRYLAFSRAWGEQFTAFGGAELCLRMADGSERKVKDHWWHGSRVGYVDVAVQTVEGLAKCFVFCGGPSIHKDDLAEFRSKYTGTVYSYSDYEKIITFDRMKSSLIKLAEEEGKRAAHEKSRRKALVAAIKKMSADLKALKASSEGGEA